MTVRALDDAHPPPPTVGLPPEVGRDPRILILGSLPGAVSLARRRYYGHPRNAFWSIVEASLGVDASDDYDPRIRGLHRHGIALWDVVHSAVRSGSADAAIRAAVPNDIAGLVTRSPSLTTILLNGRRAGELFERLVGRRHPQAFDRVSIHVLPSTSPANAAMSMAAKLESWRRWLLVPSHVPTAMLKGMRAAGEAGRGPTIEH